MSPYQATVGEAECSQDTPFPNTTPVKRRRLPRIATTPAYKRPQKPNQCMKGFFLAVDIRALDRIIDVDYDGVCQDLENDKANLQQAISSNDRILPLIEHQKEKARVADKSLDRLQAKNKGLDSQDPKSADDELLDFGAGQDDSLVEQCTKLHEERADVLHKALHNNEKVKRDVVQFIEDLRQVQTAFTEDQERHAADIRTLEQKLVDKQREFDSKINATEKDHEKELENARQTKQGVTNAEVERLRLYKTKTDQKRRELVADIKTKEEEFLRKLAREQQTFGEQTVRLSRSYQTKLAAAETAKKDAMIQLSATKERLDVVANNKADWRRYAKVLREEKKELRSRLEGIEAKCASECSHAKGKLDGIAQELRDTNSSLFDSKACLIAKDIQVKSQEVQLAQKNMLLESKGSIIEDYTLEISTLRETKMRLEKESHTQDSRLSAQSASISTQSQRLESLTTERDRLSSDLVEERKQSAVLQKQSSDASQQIHELITVKTELIKQGLEKDQKLKLHAARLMENQTQINGLVSSKTELTAQMEQQNKILSSRATKISDHEQRIEDLKGKESDIAQEVAAQRSLVTCKAQRIQVLEDGNQKLGAIIAGLRSDIGFKDSELNRNASTITSQKEHIRGIEVTIQSLLQEETKTNIAMTKLEQEVAKLKLHLHTKDENLTCQITLVTHRDATIRDLEATKTILSQAQIKATSEMDNLKTRLSKLAIELTTKDDELVSKTSTAAIKDGTIQRLEVVNADLLRLQEEAKDDEVNLRAIIRYTKGRTEDLQTTLDTRDEELSIATEETQHTRRRLEEVEEDLLAEKSANRTASLEILLKNANETVKTYSKELDGKTERLEEEKSTVKALSKELDGKTERLEEEKSTVKALSKDMNGKTERLEEEKTTNASLHADIGRLEKEQLKSSEEKKNSEKRMKEVMEILSLDRVAIQNLQSEGASKSALIDQLQKQCTLSDAERTCLLHQLMAESTRVRCVAEQLPKDLAGLISDVQDVRMFLGEHEGGPVMVRAQRFREERKAFIIVEKHDHTRVVWYESLDRCTVDLPECEWYLRMEKGLDEKPVEVRLVDVDDPYNLEKWLKGA